ncbi:MAG: hypothetical protein WD969_01710, partial [Paracoccaceae bacterium]
ALHFDKPGRGAIGGGPVGHIGDGGHLHGGGDRIEAGAGPQATFRPLLFGHVDDAFDHGGRHPLADEGGGGAGVYLDMQGIDMGAKTARQIEGAFKGGGIAVIGCTGQGNQNILEIHIAPHAAVFI